MLVMVANRIAFASLVGPSHAATSREWPSGKIALDRIARDDGVVDEQAQRDDERRDRDLLEVDPQHMHHPERHRERDRNSQRHQQGRSPFPESDQRHQHHERDRFVQASHEEVNVLVHLPWLIRCAGQGQIGRQLRAQFFKLGIDRLAKVTDLLPGPHLNGKRDRLRPAPSAIGPALTVKIQQSGRALVSSAHGHQISEVHAAAVRRRHEDIADFMFALELAGRIHGETLVADVDGSAGQRDVAGAEHLIQRSDVHAVRREAFLRVLEEHPFLNQAGAGHLRHHRQCLQRAGDQVCVVVQLAVAVPCLRPRRRDGRCVSFGSRMTTTGQASG